MVGKQSNKTFCKRLHPFLTEVRREIGPSCLCLFDLCAVANTSCKPSVVSWRSLCWKVMSMLHWVVPPPRMPVTTRTITFLVGDPYKPSFATVTGRGDNPIYTNTLKSLLRCWMIECWRYFMILLDVFPSTFFWISFNLRFLTVRSSSITTPKEKTWIERQRILWTIEQCPGPKTREFLLHLLLVNCLLVKNWESFLLLVTGFRMKTLLETKTSDKSMKLHQD